MNRVTLLSPATRVLRSVIVIGMSLFFLTIFLWLSATITPITAAPEAQTVAPQALSNNTVITIGVGATLNVLPEFGWRQANSVQLAVDQKNAAGGINIAGTDYTLALVVADDGCNASQAITATTTLLNAGAVAVVGYTCSSASNAAQPLYAAAGVPMVTPSSTALFLTEQGYTTTFRVISRDDSASIFLATYLRDWQQLERATIIALDGVTPDWATEAISTTFAGLGGAIVGHYVLTSTAAFTTTLTLIQAEDPDVIFYADANAHNAGLLSRVAHGLGMANAHIGWVAISENEAVLADYAAQAGIAAEGDHAAMDYRRTQDMPGYEAFNVLYQAVGFANYGDEAAIWGAYAYDAAQIIIAAIERAQSIDPNDIREAIASTSSYQGVVGLYEGFDARGDVIPQWGWLTQYRNGEWVLLHPAKLFLPTVLSVFAP